MDWSVNENGHARIGATQACLPRLHSHFMTEWKRAIAAHQRVAARNPRFPDQAAPAIERAEPLWDLAINSLRASIQDMPQRLIRALLVVSKA
ncbi:hypothetical protein [Mesorhizobium sp. dw_380]|uniref:hypothetical protein n=1 Tax=Mesorhizobium sp. dw_380 TaxID=2812001 RepID=UPI001BDE26E3|nr:hypothetical protein [Mesorhizobium sp. dw_380]